MALTTGESASGGDGGVYGGDGQRDWRRWGAISLSVGGTRSTGAGGAR